MTSRRGFTMIELIISLALLLIVSGATYQMLATTQRVSRAQAERVDMQSNMRVGALVIPADLRSIGYDSVVLATTQGGVARPAGTIVPDILGMAADSIAFRAIRASGMICSFPQANQIVVDTTWYYSAYRAPRITDSLLLFFDVDPGTTSDDSWFARGISSVQPATCPAAYQSRAGLRINLPSGAGGISRTGTTPPDSIVPGSPFRVFEVLIYKLYQSGGRWYLGARSATAGETAFQPMLGPLTPNGFRLDYFDANGVTTASPAQVRTIQVTLIGQSAQRVSGTGYGSQAMAADSVVTRVTLRNALR
jgi:prepilin-type N-terminal cleavage/methylation domain-containing protein